MTIRKNSEVKELTSPKPTLKDAWQILKADALDKNDCIFIDAPPQILTRKYLSIRVMMSQRGFNRKYTAIRAEGGIKIRHRTELE